MKASTLVLSLAFLFVTSSVNGSEREQEWESNAEKILEADTIIVQLNWFTRVPIWDLPKRIKHGKFYNKRFEKDFPKEEAQTLLTLLSYDESRDSRTVCGCRGVFQVEFRKEKELVFGFGYAHGKTSAPISLESELKIFSYLDSKGFLTNEWIEKEREMEDAN